MCFVPPIFNSAEVAGGDTSLLLQERIIVKNKVTVTVINFFIVFVLLVLVFEKKLNSDSLEKLPSELT